MTETATHTNEYSRVQALLLPLLELEGEAFQEPSQAFIDARLAELELEAEPQSTLGAANGNFQGFILPTTDIHPLAISEKSYRLDDKELYVNVLEQLRRHYHNLSQSMNGDPEGAYFQATLYAAQYAQQSYFGNVHTGKEGAAQRETLLEDSVAGDQTDASPYSIRDFKGLAMCSERAAAANNILQLLGSHPVMEMGRVQIGDRPDEGHVYLFVKDNKNNERLYDPTNPRLIYDTDGNLIQTSPALYMTHDVLSGRDRMAPISVTHKEFEADQAGVRVRTETPYQYFLSPMPSARELHPE